MDYVFTHEIPNNSKKLKLAFFSMLSFSILCFVGVAIALAFWDDFTYIAYSIKYQRNIEAGWPPFIYSWGLWLGIGTLIFVPFLFGMQDFKNPSLALTNEGLFINQQMIKNVLIPFSEISKIEKSNKGFKIVFKDTNSVTGRMKGISKAMAKSNLENDNFYISDTHSSGDIDGFMAELEKKLA